MAFGLPQDPRGQMFALITVVALFGVYVQWDGMGVNPFAYAKYSARADTLNRNVDSLQAIIDAARRDLQSGSIEALQRRVAEYTGMLELLRRLVPATHEVPALIDDISTKAKVRGVTLDLISAFERTGSFMQAARLLGINKTTLYRRRRRCDDGTLPFDPDLGAAMTG